MSRKLWQLFKPVPQDFIESFPEYSTITLQLLYNRGLCTEEEIEKFLNPDYENDLYDPFLMKDMEQAVRRIKKAINQKEKIVIYGDYDVDGVTAVAILYKTLKALKAPYIDYYIPDRNKEGYGLNKEAISQLVEEKIDLIITVDCGITNYEEVELANKMGIETIITDHHLVVSNLPSALAILNPQRKDDRYPFKELAGVGVAFKLVQALLKTPDNHFEPFLKWMMDLVALGTIADNVPLLDENRVFVKYGLIVLRKTKNLGLRALMAKAKVNPANLDTEEVNFQLAPRLNAASRMDHAYTSLRLLVTSDYQEAEEIAEDLNKFNNQRQKLIEKIYQQAKEQIQKIKSKEKILILAHPDWSAAVLGLVAGRLVDEFYRPVILIEKGNQESKGAARSIENFNITTALSKCSKLLIQFGGHKEAAGFSLETKNLENFKEKMSKIASSQIKDKDLICSLKIEADINPQDISWNFYEELERFRPFGIGNPSPLFRLKNVKVLESYKVGNAEKHLKLHFKNGDKEIKAIGFNLGKLMEGIKNKKKVDIVCGLKPNYWNGTCDLELEIFDLK